MQERREGRKQRGHGCGGHWRRETEKRANIYWLLCTYSAHPTCWELPELGAWVSSHPTPPTTFQTPAQLGTWLGIWCWGEFFFPGWLEELLIELLGNRNLGSGKGFTGPSEWSFSVWRLPGAPHLLLDSAGGGLRVSRERAGNAYKLFGV